MAGRTSLDLALDLAAQKQKLSALQQELESLRALKGQLHQAATDTKQHKSPPSWLNSPQTKRTLNKLASGACLSDTPEERRVSKVFRRTKREIHKMRHSHTSPTQPDLLSFREKMAFFLNASSSAAADEAGDELAVPLSPVSSTEPSDVCSVDSDLQDPTAFFNEFGGEKSLSILDSEASTNDSGTLTKNKSLSSSEATSNNTNDSADTVVLAPQESSSSSDDSQVLSATVAAAAAAASPEKTSPSVGTAEKVIPPSTPSEKLITRVSLNTPLSRSPHFVTSTPYRSASDASEDRKKIPSPVPPTPVRHESLLLSGSSKNLRLPRDISPVAVPIVRSSTSDNSSRSANFNAGNRLPNGEPTDDDEVPIVPKRTTSLLPSEKVQHRERRSGAQDTPVRPTSSVVCSDSSRHEGKGVTGESNLTTVLSRSSPSVCNNKLKTSTLTVQSNINGNPDSRGAVSRPSSSIFPSDGYSSESSTTVNHGLASSTRIVNRETQSATKDLEGNISIISISDNSSVPATDECTSTNVSSEATNSTLANNNKNLARQLTARQSVSSRGAARVVASLDAPASANQRPDVIFNNDDLGVEV